MNLQTPKFTLLAIGTLFLVPLLIAGLMRSSWWNFEPSSFANRGILLEPPVPLSLTTLDIQHSDYLESPSENKRWVLLYPVDENCDVSCLKDIASLRQVHLATGRKQARVAVWLLSEFPLPTELTKRVLAVYPALDILLDTKNTALNLLELKSNGPESTEASLRTGLSTRPCRQYNIALHAGL
jgi:hypothetical protein